MPATGKRRRTVEAERIVLADRKGRPRLVLGLLGGELPAIELRAADGRVAARLSEANGLPVLHFWDRHGKLCLSITVAPDGSSGLVAGDHEGSGHANLFSAGGEPYLVLTGTDGKAAVFSARGLKRGRGGAGQRRRRRER
ncbi:MAG: hypothetical protein HY721_07045 [Planctomycetes bacterium]|nr:hypothetical protein [Planctomycetota bacterium]